MLFSKIKNQDVALVEKQVFTVNHVGLTCTAKEIHSLILDGVSEEEKKAVKDGFIRECYHSSLIDTSSEHSSVHGRLL